MSKRFDAKKYRAASYCVSGYQFPATRIFLVAFFVIEKGSSLVRKIFILFMISIILNGFHSAISQAHEAPVNSHGCHRVVFDTVYLPLDKTYITIYDDHCHNEEIADADNNKPTAPDIITETGFYFGSMAALAPTHDSSVEIIEFDNSNSIGVVAGTKISQNFGFEFILKNTNTQTKISTTITSDGETLPVESNGTLNIVSTIFNAVIYANPTPTGQQFFVSYGTGSSEADYKSNDITVDLGDDFTVTRTAIGVQFKVKEIVFANNQSQSWYLRLGLFNENHGDNEISGIELGLIGF